MGKYFTFVDRFIPVEFFEDDPIKVTIQISDATDMLILDMSKKLDATKDVEAGKAALAEVLGAENVDAILARTEAPDKFALVQIAHYVIQAYKDGKTKNLETARAGRKRK